MESRANHNGKQLEELEMRLRINEYVAAESDSEESRNDVDDDEFDERTPEQKANILSKLTFSWLSAMFKTGYKRQIQIEDLNYLPIECYADNTNKAFNKYWMNENVMDQQIEIKLKEPLMREEQNESNNSNKRNLLKALLSAFGRPFYMAAPLKILSICVPFINVLLVSSYLSDAQNMENGSEFIRAGLMYSFFLFLNNMIGTIISTQYELKCEITSMNIRSGIICSCYDKVLILTNGSRGETTSGSIMTLITVDVNKISWIFRGIWDLVLCPIQILIALYLLYNCIGWSIFISLLIQIVTISPIKAYTVKKAKEYQTEIMSIRDDRMKIINEVCKAIKVIKMYGWISSFADKITKIRINEVKIFKYLQCLYKSMWFYWELVPILLAIISLSIFTSIGGILTVEKAFVSLMLFYELRNPIQRIPGIILGLIDANVSLKRVKTFLSLNQININTIQYYYNHHNITDNCPVISCLNTSFSWDDKGDIMALNNLDIEFKRGTITMIVGETGSGKTALLNALLGNLTKIGYGSIYHHNKNIQIGYSSQIAWIQNATIRENILFGNKYNKTWYDKVIKICALSDDLKILIAGDKTEIGEKGINLSGGQKQRLSLARAIYSNSDIFIFDDILSAVDSNVGNYIFTNCIQNYLLKENKTVILATHAISFLKYANNIIVMDKGNISLQGTLQDLIDANINLTKFIVHHNNHDKEEEEEEEEEGKEEEEEKKHDDIDDNEKEKDKKDTDKENGKLIDDEERDIGHVSFDIYKLYAKSSYGIYLFISFLLISLFYLIFENIFDVYWLSYWSNSIHDDATTKHHDSWWYLSIYIGLRFGALIILSIQIIIEIISRLKAANYFHKILLNKILNARQSFFDTTPIGRIISRFSKDINLIDNSLNESFKDSVRSTFSILTCIISVCIVIPYLLIIMIPLYIFYYFLQKYFISTSRELKRLMSLLNAPIYSNFSETIHGAKIIKSFKKTNDFIKKNQDKVNANQQARYASFCCYRWYRVRLDFISNCLVLSGCILCAFIKPNSGKIGIILVMATHVTGSLNWFVNRISQLEQDIVSVERIDQYSNNQFLQEQQIKNNKQKINISSDWPNKGIIEFKNVFMKYRDNLPFVLNGLTFKVNNGERIGIIGRTGAGKSSLFVTLLRLVEIEKGNIFIDNIDISCIPLQILRSKISIIPQDPILFTGNIRFNLDPFNPTTMRLYDFLNKHNKLNLLKKLKKIGITTVDELYQLNIENTNDIEQELEDIILLKQYLKDYDLELIKALKLSHCYQLLMKNKNNDNNDDILDINVDENGSNFSLGERQLICLSRAIVRKSSILLLDEATSSIDAETDKLIQETIRNVFYNKTILTIAHRIDTILDYNRILIMDKGGKILQYDTPKNLLNNKNSKFAKIVQESFGTDIKYVESYLLNNNNNNNINVSHDSCVSCV